MAMDMAVDIDVEIDVDVEELKEHGNLLVLDRC
jgi:hypothetical protein